MSQIESGIRSILSNPIVYNFFQNLLGAQKNRADLVNNYVKPGKNDNILDIGCGTADNLAFLPGGVKYFGYDQSEAYIAHAKKVFGDRGIFTCQIVDDVVTDELPDMDVVLASGLIHHLNDDEVITLLNISKKALKKGGRLITIDPCFSEDQNKISKWLVSKDRGQNVRDQNGYNSLAKSVFSNVESYVIHRKWVPYTHHILVCTL